MGKGEQDLTLRAKLKGGEETAQGLDKIRDAEKKVGGQVEVLFPPVIQQLVQLSRIDGQHPADGVILLDRIPVSGGPAFDLGRVAGICHGRVSRQPINKRRCRFRQVANLTRPIRSNRDASAVVVPEIGGGVNCHCGTV